MNFINHSKVRQVELPERNVIYDQLNEGLSSASEASDPGESLDLEDHHDHVVHATHQAKQEANKAVKSAHPEGYHPVIVHAGDHHPEDPHHDHLADLGKKNRQEKNLKSVEAALEAALHQAILESRDKDGKFDKEKGFRALAKLLGQVPMDRRGHYLNEFLEGLSNRDKEHLRQMFITALGMESNNLSWNDILRLLSQDHEKSLAMIVERMNSKEPQDLIV